MNPHEAVTTFLDENDLRAGAEYRIFDLVSEVGEVAKNVNTSTDYGKNPDAIRIQPDELGDVLFATYALAEETGIDPQRALEKSLDKYRTRLTEGEDPGSSEH